MRNIRIYLPEDLQAGQSVQLDKASSNHLLRVLRLKQGQTFTLFNGRGGEYRAQLQIDNKKAIAQLLDFTDTEKESPLSIHLLQGVAKGERMDFVIQKSVELGVNKITPVICERSVVNLKGERAQKKNQHWQKIAISACEQSGRNFVPEVSASCHFSELSFDSSNQLRLLLDPLSPTPVSSLKPESEQLTIFIGPEGGLSADEIQRARKHWGFQSIKLGPRILRTETAALSAITICQLLWGDLA